MPLRSFRIILLLTCLLGSVILSGALASRAATPSTHRGRSFQPSSHGVATPQVVNTATMPQFQATQLQSASIIPQRAVSSRPSPKPLASPSNVVNVPPPTSILQQGSDTSWLSVAQQPSATGKFCNYSFTFNSGHDFDKLGVDKDGIYFSANLLNGNGQLVGNELFFASRTVLESCQTATYTNWTNLTNPDGSLASAITPARQDSSANSVEYLVNSYPSGACQLTLWTLTSAGNLSNTSVPTQCYSRPPLAKQEGSSALLASGDCSITQASYVHGLLTVDTLGSYDWGDGHGPVGIVEWYVINPATASVSSQGAFGTPGYYPSTITTSNGHMLFVYNASGPNGYPSVWYVNQTMTGTTALVNGVSYDGTSGVTPWGDYQSAWPDATGKGPNSVWITGEYVKATNVWGTEFDLVTP